MDDTTRRARQDQIEAAAYDVLEQKGYDGASMLAVAKQARASNETLYRWYGDKRGLFAALVVRNARDVTELLRGVTDGDDPMAVLRDLGPLLVRLVTSDRAVALNRAAAADGSGALGAAIAEHGRETVQPLLVSCLLRARDRGLLRFDTPDAPTALYLDCLIGDLQIRRVIGRAAAPDAEACAARSERALAVLMALYGPGDPGAGRG
ncbi:TetR family transcriptional regulator [Jannaschia pagri]|uniref:TetR family transcriptional regulator n=1 Tax=Jannaschia pagri TaxID=2829797 RepID=A0ABQ4NQV0_9RHOB|nr:MULTISPECIES: TetR/AcrR family transcriptional regulator [unclassified Jannaschia]GIT92886.1 TetR family transcriptional regulator [Jannaschia sp. AI_61]GIT96721.1 TetR family transcriptional regulator [Jannaschia sp. AI_62]